MHNFTDWPRRPSRSRLITIVAALLSAAACACHADPPAVPSASAPPLTSAPSPPVALPGDFTTRSVSLSFKQAKMADVITALARQSGHSLLVNDEPRDNSADVEFKGTLKAALDTVGEAYDYTWRLGKHNVVLLTKQFSRHDEYPPLLPGEFLQTAQDSLAVLGAIDISRFQSRAVLGRAVWEALTPEQKAQLQAGHVIEGRQLDAAARQRLDDIILYTALDGLGTYWQTSVYPAQMLSEATSASALDLEQRDTHFASSDAGMFVPSEKHIYILRYVVADKRGKKTPMPIYTVAELPRTKPASNAKPQEKTR